MGSQDQTGTVELHDLCIGASAMNLSATDSHVVSFNPFFVKSANGLETPTSGRRIALSRYG